MYNMNDGSRQEPVIAKASKPSLFQVASYFGWLGTTGFGGPIALTGRMQRDLVDERRWFSHDEFLEALALAQLAPGPLAAQLAIYLGYLRAGTLGATVVGFLFIVPSFLMVCAIAVAYKEYAGLPWVQAAFYGIGPAAIAVIANAASKLTVSVVGRDRLLWTILLILAATTAILEREIMWLFLAAGLLTLLVRRRQIGSGGLANCLLVAGSLAAPGGASLSLFLFFAKASLFVFGSGLAIVPFLHAGVVEEQHWLTEREFLDAVAVAMITPGPVVIMVAFIGYLVKGWVGASLATLGVFLPTYLVVVLLAPVYRRFSAVESLRIVVSGVTAAAAGALAGATLILARQCIVNVPTAALAILAFLALRRRVPEAAVIGAAGLLGLFLHQR
jgi:chromate transporter